MDDLPQNGNPATILNSLNASKKPNPPKYGDGRLGTNASSEKLRNASQEVGSNWQAHTT